MGLIKRLDLPGKKERTVSTTKLVAGAAGLLLFIVGVKKSVDLQRDAAARRAGEESQ